VDDGQISDRRTWAEIPVESGSPDGMAIDEEGGLWVAMWGGWSVHRYVEGRLDRVVRLPVAEVSSCSLGGADLDVLFITTARDELSETERREQPLAGGLFRFEPGVPGRAVADYRG
jgi:sugar lactone lactonase YvrE